MVSATYLHPDGQKGELVINLQDDTLSVLEAYNKLDEHLLRNGWHEEESR